MEYVPTGQEVNPGVLPKYKHSIQSQSTLASSPKSRSVKDRSVKIFLKFTFFNNGKQYFGNIYLLLNVEFLEKI